MSISCLVITTNKSERFVMLDKAIMSVEKNAKCSFKEKVLSVDWLDDYPPTLENFKKYQDLGWIVIGGWCTGQRAMINNITRGLAEITSDILFYCEDHIIIERVPDDLALDTLFMQSHPAPYLNVGWVCYNTHIVEENLLGIPGFVQKEDKDNFRAKYINDKKNYVSCAGETFLKKSLNIADEYYLNFPAAIIETNIFKHLLSYGVQQYHDIGIEIGFTRAWMDLYPKHDVVIYVKNRPRRRVTFKKFHDLAQMRFRNNDPSMLHKSLFKHQELPDDNQLKNNFF